MERPILFSGPMVRAILEGRKTVTRRVAKPHGFNSILSGDWSDAYVLLRENHSWLMEDSPCDLGDSLWVRETFATCYLGTDASDERYSYSVDPKAWKPARPGTLDTAHIAYRADSEEPLNGPWRPSIHMPRWASRLSLDVLSVRLERLQEITEEDAVAEGIERGKDFFGCPTWKDYQPETEAACWFPDDPVGSFHTLWDSLATKGADWDANPWVWRIEFRKGGAK